MTAETEKPFDAETLRETVWEMANRASVDIELWQRHSTAAITAAAVIEQQAAELARLTKALTDIREHVERSVPTGYRLIGTWNIADRALSAQEKQS